MGCEFRACKAALRENLKWMNFTNHGCLITLLSRGISVGSVIHGSQLVHES